MTEYDNLIVSVEVKPDGIINVKLNLDDLPVHQKVFVSEAVRIDMMKNFPHNLVLVMSTDVDAATEIPKDGE